MERPRLDTEPIRINVYPKNKNNKKIKKDGTVLAYKCRFCNYQAFHLESTRAHSLQKCVQYRNLVKQLEEKSLHEQNVKLLSEELRSEMDIFQNPKPLNLEERVKALENQIMRNSVTSITPQSQAKLIAEDFISEISNLIQGTLKLGLAKTITHWLEAEIDVRQLKYAICQKLMMRIREIPMFDLVDTFKKSLQQYHKKLQEISKPKVHEKTWFRISSAYKFLRKYDQINFQSQHKIVSDLMNQTLYLRKNVLQYYSKMIHDYSDIFPYRQLPRRLKNFDQNLPKKLQKISLQDVKREVKCLIQNGESILATDLWAITVTGFRKTQILRMVFSDENQIFAEAIRICERKNRHETLRLIPKSLKILISEFSVSYPMPLSRFVRVREHCLRRFERFYGIRHLCITSLVVALYENSALARVHKSPQNTQKFYLDDTSALFINKMFSLESLQAETIPNYRQEQFLIIINEDGTYHREEKEGAKIQFGNPYENQEEPLELAHNDSILLSTQKDMNEHLRSLNSFEKVNQAAQWYLVKNYDQEMKEQSFPTTEDIFNELLDENFHEELSEFCQSKCERISNKKTLEFAQAILNLGIQYLTFNEKHLMEPIREKISINQQNIYVVKLETDQNRLFKVSQNDELKLRRNLPRKSKENIFYGQECLPFLTFKHPKCLSCPQRLSTKLNLQLCSICKKGYLSCPKCFQVLTHSCEQKKNACSSWSERQIQILSTHELFCEDFFQDFTPNFQKNKSKSDRNRIKEYIEIVQKKKYQNRVSGVYHDVPLRIYTGIGRFSKEMCDEINFNRSNQPKNSLRIKKTQEKGLGVFATEVIQPKKLICSYIGRLGTHQSVDLEHDSSFFLGWLETVEKKPLGLFLEAKEEYNLGRFLNSASSEESQEINCQCKIGLSQNNLCIDEDFTEISIIIYSCRKINIGEELLWYYGREYWLHD